MTDKQPPAAQPLALTPYGEALDRIADLERDLAEANSLAHSRAMTIERLEKDLAAAQADVREHIALCLAANKLVDEAKADLAAAQAERDAAFEMSRCECGTDEACANLARLHKERDEAKAEAAALREQYGRVRDAFHVNMLRAYPELSHADIDAAIDAARGSGNG